MKKLLTVFLFVMLVFSGCGHTHEWKNATCTEPRKCVTCGETEGEALGHKWEEATCVSPKTCSVCGLTEGSPTDHIWVEATCAAPKTCSVCGKTEGTALEHTWEEATCSSPMKCKVCGAISGDPLPHTWIEATCTEPKVCSVCGKTEGVALGHDYSGVTCTESARCPRCGETLEATGHKLSEATCTEAPVCSVCGAVVGEPLGHTTSSGICSRCGLEIFETVTGKGDDVRTGITIDDSQIYRVHFTHSGRSNFIVKAYDSNDNYDLLINEIGNYEGYVFLMGTSPLLFEIKADGNWSYTIEKLGTTSDLSFSGKGDYVTPISPGVSGVYRFTHNGKSNFIIRAYTTDGRDLIVNEIGKYDGKAIVRIPTGSNIFFEVIADGNWTISPES